MAVKNQPSRHSPKNKYRASIHYDKPLKGLGSSSTAMAMTIPELKSRISFYTDQAKNKNRVGSSVRITENTEKYPKFNWVHHSSFKVKV
jgi:hypothetical protein